MGFYTDKDVLVTGGTGLIGRQLVDLLLEKGAYVSIVSLDDPEKANPAATFYQADLTEMENCEHVCEDKDIVFHLAGTKGSPKMMKERPADYFVKPLLYNTSMMEAAKQCEVERYLYTSTVGVYAPAEIFHEDDVWKTFPSENDRFAGWAKRMGELQAQAYEIQDGWDKISIVRPANVYGPYDNLDPSHMTALTAITTRAINGENPLKLHGDGTAVRDFIHARDVARGMMLVVEHGYNKPVNIGSGKGYSIKEIAETVVNNLEDKPEIVWDTSQPSGDKIRIVDTSRINSLGFQPEVSLDEGIKEVMAWYKEEKYKSQ